MTNLKKFNPVPKIKEYFGAPGQVKTLRAENAQLASQLGAYQAFEESSAEENMYLNDAFSGLQANIQQATGQEQPQKGLEQLVSAHKISNQASSQYQQLEQMSTQIFGFEEGSTQYKNVKEFTKDVLSFCDSFKNTTISFNDYKALKERVEQSIVVGYEGARVYGIQELKSFKEKHNTTITNKMATIYGSRVSKPEVSSDDVRSNIQKNIDSFPEFALAYKALEEADLTTKKTDAVYQQKGLAFIERQVRPFGKSIEDLAYVKDSNPVQNTFIGDLSKKQTAEAFTSYVNSVKTLGKQYDIDVQPLLTQKELFAKSNKLDVPYESLRDIYSRQMS